MVIHFLRQHLDRKESVKSGARIVAEYCAAELLRAGATETGLVADPDQLPDDLGDSFLEKYRDTLGDFAEFCGQEPHPWYLRQQAELFLRFLNRNEAPGIQRASAILPTSETASLDLAKEILLEGHYKGHDKAVESFVVLTRGGKQGLVSAALGRIVRENQELANAILAALPQSEKATYNDIFAAYGTVCAPTPSDTERRLISLGSSEGNPFQQEYAALHLARRLLQALTGSDRIVSPQDVAVACSDWSKLAPSEFPIAGDAIKVDLRSTALLVGSRYALPDWVKPSQRHGYQLGQLLRVVLTGRPDFTHSYPTTSNTETDKRYRPYKSAWLKRRYGLFNGRAACHGALQNQPPKGAIQGFKTSHWFSFL